MTRTKKTLSHCVWSTDDGQGVKHTSTSTGSVQFRIRISITSSLLAGCSGCFRVFSTSNSTTLYALELGHRLRITEQTTVIRIEPTFKEMYR